MNQRVIHWNPSSGVWGFGAAWPNNGPWAVTLPGVGVQTATQIIPPSPGASLMYLDVVAHGAIAGQGHQGDRVWFWLDVWADKGIAWGPHAQCFRNDGTLAVIKDQAEYQATGGWRYCRDNGTLVSVVNSYADPARGLYEWTEWPDIAIGQGGKPDQGAVVWTPARGLLRLGTYNAKGEFLPMLGQLRCIVAKRVADDFAITVIDPTQALTTITYATLAELQALPLVAPKPPEPPVEPPVPPVEPPPVDPPPVDPPPVEPPPEPEPEPPIPPVIGVPMDVERGWLIGPGDKVLSVTSDGVVRFQTSVLSDLDLLEATPVASMGDPPRAGVVVRSVLKGVCLGADATKHTPTGNVCQQYYGKVGDAGNYELWTFGQWPSGIVQAVVEYVEQGADNGRQWQAAGLTWVKQG